MEDHREAVSDFMDGMDTEEAWSGLVWSGFGSIPSIPSIFILRFLVLIS